MTKSLHIHYTRYLGEITISSIASSVLDPLWDFSIFRRRRGLLFQFRLQIFSTTRRNFQSVIFVLFLFSLKRSC